VTNLNYRKRPSFSRIAIRLQSLASLRDLTVGLIEGRAMEPFSRDLRDPDIDGPDNSLSKSEGSKPHVTIWLLAGIALVSMAWGGSAIYRDLQRERVFVRTVSRPHSEEPKCRRPKRAELEPLFPKTPL
jgi:hypothetical protein